MQKAFDDFAQDKNARVAILTGAGEKAFSAGNDLKFQAEHGVEGFVKYAPDMPNGFGGLVERFDCYKPIIAAVNGLAMGGGFELALACDILLASENAFFSFPEPRVGLMADAGGVHKLPRRIPYHVAMDIMLTSRRVLADEAKQLGLVSQVVPANQLMDTAYKIAGEILKGSPIALQSTKQCATEGLQMSIEEVMKASFSKRSEMYKSGDSREGPRAFAEKREPKWEEV